MGRDVCCAGRLKDTRGRGDLVGRTVRQHAELVKLEGHLLLHNAILGDANTVQSGRPAPQRAARQRAEDNDGTKTRVKKTSGVP